MYLDENKLHVEDFGRGFAWLDTGTFDSLMDASNFVQVIEHRQGYKIACLEELGFRNGWISRAELLVHAKRLGKTGYGKYLKLIAGEQ